MIISPALTASTTTLTYNAASQVSTYTYDAMGHLTDDGTRTYMWDLASRLTGYTEGANTVTFTYDALGYRTTRTEGGVTRTYVWNYALGLPSVSVIREGGSDVRYYVHTPGGSLLYSIEAADGTRRDYHYDEMGNTLFLTDSTGTVVASYAYPPYGTLLSSTGTASNPFTWQGQYGIMQEGTSGLYYMRARYYDSNTGKFMSRDPVISIEPQRVNPYQYALASPLRFIDPTGTEEELPWLCRKFFEFIESLGSPPESKRETANSSCGKKAAGSETLSALGDLVSPIVDPLEEDPEKLQRTQKAIEGRGKVAKTGAKFIEATTAIITVIAPSPAIPSTAGTVAIGHATGEAVEGATSEEEGWFSRFWKAIAFWK